MDPIRYEKDLYEPVKSYLSHHGFEIRAEVKNCDLVAKKGDLVLVVELKRQLSFDLLAQAVERQSFANGVYIAVPKLKSFKDDRKWKSKVKILKKLNLGLLLVSKIGETFTVEEALSPEPLDTQGKNNKKRSRLEKEFEQRQMDLNIGGSCRIPLVTAYREATLHLVYLINREGPQTAKTLKQLGSHPKKTSAILSSNYYHWFSRLPDKRYTLNDHGITALETYAPLIKAFENTYALIHCGEKESPV